MITSDGKLQVFERFEVDRRLPKFQRPKKSSFGEGDNEREAMGSWGSGSIVTADGGAFFVANGMGHPAPPPPWYQKLLTWIRPARVQPALPTPPSVPVEEFFTSVKNSTEEVQVVAHRLAGYKKALVDAERNGQTALFEQLSKDVAAVRSETQLLASGLGRYLTEEDLVRFVKETHKGVRLDLVKNFTRVIPDDVSATKAQCDGLGIFDNYAVLHYDPKGKAWADTEEEKARKRDPILFGLIDGRRRLYFVGDWVDDYCDLTLEQVADLLGEGAVAEVKPDFVVP